MHEERTILENLMNRKAIGGKHTAIRNAIRGLPKYNLKIAKKTVKKLFNEEILLPKQTNYGLHVSINPKKLEEVYRRLRQT